MARAAPTPRSPDRAGSRVMVRLAPPAGCELVDANLITYADGAAKKAAGLVRVGSSQGKSPHRARILRGHTCPLLGTGAALPVRY